MTMTPDALVLFPQYRWRLLLVYSPLLLRLLRQWFRVYHANLINHTLKVVSHHKSPFIFAEDAALVYSLQRRVFCHFWAPIEFYLLEFCRYQLWFSQQIPLDTSAKRSPMGEQNLVCNFCRAELDTFIIPLGRNIFQTFELPDQKTGRGWNL